MKPRPSPAFLKEVIVYCNLKLRGSHGVARGRDYEEIMPLVRRGFTFGNAELRSCISCDKCSSSLTLREFEVVVLIWLQ